MKKKINTALNFPEILDMGKYIKFDNPDDGIYHLSSVLIHRGLSAHSGHYIAHIHDKEVCIFFIWKFFKDKFYDNQFYMHQRSFLFLFLFVYFCFKNNLKILEQYLVSF